MDTKQIQNLFLDYYPPEPSHIMTRSDQIQLIQKSRRSCSSVSRPSGLELPQGESDWLFVEALHDFSDSGQICSADGEVAARGPHVVAHLTLFTAQAVALGSGCDAVFTRVQ